MDMTPGGRIAAVLGPTNTGKTHYALERMLAHRTGVIGLPLRLLAREVYDRLVALRGPSVVALVTGEERIVPERAAYWVATVEAMPEVMPDFLAVDEIQLCADPERGHVFTDRLLNARGRLETLFLGAETMRPAIAALVPGVRFQHRKRFSALSWAGEKKLGRLPARSAIVGFSVDAVYEIAELLRRQKGGAAVVMGALSPRTRNAQVALYQQGDVDYLVATDAIGMGLNLDIAHVAFSATAKFDGRRTRPLWPQELAQIAGRAGRHFAPGTFGVTAGARPPDPEVIAQIEESRFAPLERLVWRNAALEFGTLERLIASLERPSPDRWLARARDADDLTALKALAGLPEVAARATAPARIALLWQVCRIPDFRGIAPSEHAALLGRIFDFLTDLGRVPDDWLAAQVARLDRPEGDIDTLSRRLAFIRTWTYVAQRAWVDDEAHWRAETRAVEDRLSDALHARLTQRFVDRRTSVLMRRLKDKESLVAEVNDKGEVTVEGEHVGRLEGFRFRLDRTGSPDEAKTLRQAAEAALKPHFALRADRCYNAPDTEFDFTEQGGLMWGEVALGKLVKGPEPLRPGIEAFVDEEAGPEVAEKVQRRLQHFLDRRVAALFEPLLALQKDAALTGLARGFAFRLGEGFGILPRAGVAAEVKALDQEARSALRRHGVRFGQYTVFLPALLKPAPTRLRLVLWALWQGLPEFPESPPPGLVTIPWLEGVPAGSDAMAGYHRAGTCAIRIDMLERLADQIRGEDSRAGFEARPEMLSITGMTLEQFAALMQGLGYAAEKGERPRGSGPQRAKETRAEARAGHEAATPVAGAAMPEGQGPAAQGSMPEAADLAVPPGGEAAAGGPGGEAAVPVPISDPAAVAAPDAALSPPPPEEPSPEVAPVAASAPVAGPETAPPARLPDEPAAILAGETPPGTAPLSAASPEDPFTETLPAGAGLPAAGADDPEHGGPGHGGPGQGAASERTAAPVTAGGPESAPEAMSSAATSPAMESFYTFAWRPRPRSEHRGGARRGDHADEAGSAGRSRRGRDGKRESAPPREAAAPPDGRPAPEPSGRSPDSRSQDRPSQDGRGKRHAPAGAPSAKDGERRGKGGPRKTAPGQPQERIPHSFEARPSRAEQRALDPDNPFAILATLKGKG